MRTISYGASVFVIFSHFNPRDAELVVRSSISTPTPSSNSRIEPTSPKRGMFSKNIFSLVSKVVAMSGRAAFFAPLISIFPESFDPPVKMILSMRTSNTLIKISKVFHWIRDTHLVAAIAPIVRIK